MIHRIPASSRHFSDFGWLKTYWLFSFDDYYDPANIQFSTLRVFNDDIIAPHAGFPLHGHKEMEIVTVMLDGELTHEDSLGNRASIRRGDIQRMTAGRGIRHSEYNHGDAPVHLYQLWLEPNQTGLMPEFVEHNFLHGSPKSGFTPLVSGRGDVPAPLTLSADAVIYRAAIEAGRTVDWAAAGRALFFYVTSGSCAINQQRFDAGDQARIVDEAGLQFEALDEVKGLLVDLPPIGRVGRGE